MSARITWDTPLVEDERDVRRYFEKQCRVLNWLEAFGEGQRFCEFNGPGVDQGHER